MVITCSKKSKWYCSQCSSIESLPQRMESKLFFAPLLSFLEPLHTYGRAYANYEQRVGKYCIPVQSFALAASPCCFLCNKFFTTKGLSIPSLFRSQVSIQYERVEQGCWRHLVDLTLCPLPTYCLATGVRPCQTFTFINPTVQCHSLWPSLLHVARWWAREPENHI